MKLSKKSFVLGFVFPTLILMNTQSINNESIKKTFTNSEIKTKIQTVDYVDLYNKAYDMTIKQGTPLCNFEQFKSLFNDLNVDENTFLKEIKNRSVESLNSSQPIETYTSPTADYILTSNVDYARTPISTLRSGFIPAYSNFSFADVEEGDLIIEYTGSTGTFTGHVGIVYDTKKQLDNGDYYIQTVEAVGEGVCFGYYDDMRMVNYRALLYKPTTPLTNSQVSDLKYFLSKQIGKKYNSNFSTMKNDINSNGWYCSELAYAAYKYAGYNLGNMTRVWPDDFRNSSNFKLTNQIRNYGIKISNYGGSFANWNINVKNIGTTDVSVVYNTKMCFTADAMNWTNLTDTKFLYLNIGGNLTVSVGFNWFADAVAFSYVLGKNRYITYGNCLDGTISSIATYERVVPYKTEAR